jgi:hypothetical protein
MNNSSWMIWTPPGQPGETSPRPRSVLNGSGCLHRYLQIIRLGEFQASQELLGSRDCYRRGEPDSDTLISAARTAASSSASWSPSRVRPARRHFHTS